MNTRLLDKRQVEKVWGHKQLPVPFTRDQQAGPIGEIWFEPPEELAGILVKYLFTKEKLSVQVHPPAHASPTGRGKEECWLVLNAEPRARLALGFREPVTHDRMKAAAIDGSIEDLLEWYDVTAGDFFYLPAGTVHAIGAGLTLLEVQENTDITYRLFDYGRPRELHLEKGLSVACGDIHPENLRRRIESDEECLIVNGPCFRLAQLLGAPSPELSAKLAGPVQILPLAGNVHVDEQAVEPGESAITAHIGNVAFTKDARTIIVAQA